MMRLWRLVPAVVRAVLVGELATSIGGLAALFLLWNLRFLPRVPWSIPATAAWLWLFWRYASGWGWPRATRDSRRRDLRAVPLPGRVWRWSLLAGGLAGIGTVALAFLTQRVADLPLDAFRLPIDLSAYPAWMVVWILLAISVIAGVTEEAGFRGFMLSQIERRHGWIVATLVTGFVFFLDHHFSHAYATFAFLPFFMTISAVHALLVYLTGSILPSVVLHSVLDFLVIPVQYGLVGGFPTSSVLKTGVDASFLGEAAILVACGAAAVPAFGKLGAAARAHRAASGVRQPSSGG